MLNHLPSPDCRAHPFFTSPPRIRPTNNDLEKLAEIINAAKRPVIFGGEGCRDAREQVLALSRKLNAPVGYTFRGKDILEADNSNAVGMIGLLGWGGLQHAVSACDLFIMLGTDFFYQDFLPKHTKTVQIDSDAVHIGRRTSLECGLCGHIAETLDALIPLVRSRGDDRAFLDEMLKAHQTEAQHLKMYVDHGGSDGKLRPEQVGDAISRLSRLRHHLYG